MRYDRERTRERCWHGCQLFFSIATQGTNGSVKIGYQMILPLAISCGRLPIFHGPRTAMTKCCC
ncbi:hypothetical protein M758_UG260100 [Ceratodon purpureus]|nr:hypothetical protein M758_UG260100 [Ceratodon purpureus]